MQRLTRDQIYHIARKKVELLRKDREDGFHLALETYIHDAIQEAFTQVEEQAEREARARQERL